MRRTKEQINYDDYANGVDEYKWFIVNTDTFKIMCGYEYKDDCYSEIEDNDMKDYTRVISLRTARNQFPYFDAMIAEWKGIRPQSKINRTFKSH